MPTKTEVDLNLLFGKINNQFLAAIIGIIVLVISAITLIISGSGTLSGGHLVGVGALIVVSFIASFNVLKLNSTSVNINKAREQRDQNMSETSHDLWRLMVGLGEVCLESEVPDKKRVFVSDALSQVIENELECVRADNFELITILQGIKSSSDSEIIQNKTFSMVLNSTKPT